MRDAWCWGAWHPLKGRAGAQRELLRVGGPTGKTPGWAERLLGRDLLEERRVVKARDSNPSGLFQIPPRSCPNLRLDLPVFTFACKQSDFF